MSAPRLTNRERWLMKAAWDRARGRTDGETFGVWLQSNHPNDQHHIPWDERLASDAPALATPPAVSTEGDAYIDGVKFCADFVTSQGNTHEERGESVEAEALYAAALWLKRAATPSNEEYVPLMSTTAPVWADAETMGVANELLDSLAGDTATTYERCIRALIARLRVAPEVGHG